MKRCLLFSILVSSCYLSMGQITATFKPNATVGKDAPIMKFDNDCIATITTETPANINYGAESTLYMKDWTWSSIGCNGGTLRSLLCFTQLDTIPDNAVILSATLRLYGTNADRNTSYPGAPSGFHSNTVIVQQVTSPWNESTVTWNTQPTTTTTNQFTIPQSNAEYNWNCTISNSDLVAMVQNMVSGNNYGFMLKLETEVHYRNMVFSSSDCSDSTLWPELEITYRYCNPHFSMLMVDSEHPNTRTFTAFEQGGQHIWKYGSQILSNLPVFTTTFNQSLSDGFFHTVIINGDTCTDCMKLCLGDVPRKVAEINTETEDIFVPQGVVPLGDEVGEMPDRETLKAVPNPNSGECSLYFDANESDFASVELYDSEGRTVLLQNIEIKKGKNSFDLDCSQCKSGIYTIVIKGNTTNLSQKINVIKKS